MVSFKIDKKTPESQMERLAIDGGVPIRRTALPLEFPGVHHMDEQEINAALRVLQSHSFFRYYGINPQKEVLTFESEFAAFVGTSHCLAVSSGTGALHTALAALGVGPGQEIIVPAYLWVSVVAAVVNLGAIPVLADVNDTFCLDPSLLEEKITPRTSGVIAVHMSGAMTDIDAIQKITRDRKLFLLEDCAQCVGGSIHGKKVGSFGDIATFSFQANKNMTSGEGGCIVTSNEHLYDRAVACHDSGYPRDTTGHSRMDKPEIWLWGFGYRMDELRASILRVQLKKLPTIIAHMHRSKYRIRKALERYPEVHLRKIIDPDGDTSSVLLTTFQDSATAKEIQRALRAEGIGTFDQGINNIMLTEWGLHLYYNIPSLVNKTGISQKYSAWSLAENKESQTDYRKGNCPYADSLFERSILIAIPSSLTEEDEQDIIRAFEKVLKHFQNG